MSESKTSTIRTRKFLTNRLLNRKQFVSVIFCFLKALREGKRGDFAERLKELM